MENSKQTNSRWRRQRGQTLVEFALILILLLLVIMGIIDFGRILFIYTNLFNAAREGARQGAVAPHNIAAIQNAVNERVSLVNPADVALTICCDVGPGSAPFFCDQDSSVPWSCGDGTGFGHGPSGLAGIGDRVDVSVQYTLAPLTPLVMAIVPELPIQTTSARTIATIGDAYIPPSPPGGWGGGGGEICDNGIDDDSDGNIDCLDFDCNAISICVGELSLTIVPDPDTVYSGDSVEFTYTLQNTGDAPLRDVSIADIFGNTFNIGHLAPGETVVRTATEAIYTTMTVYVSASGTDPTDSVVLVTASTVVTVLGPSIDLTVTGQPPMVYSGDLVTWTYTVQNTGDADLFNVTVVDSFGTPIDPITLTVGGPPVFWQILRSTFETTVNNVSASGTDQVGTTVNDYGSATVMVEIQPILITEPLNKDATTVQGTAERGQIVFIRDLMDATFPNDSAVVLADGTFMFTGLPPLRPRHVIVVEGYGEFDSALVAGDFVPIQIARPLCDGRTVITGTAEPGYQLAINIAGAFYEDYTRVGPNGVFTFTLPTAQPVQYNQTIAVSGYDQTDTIVVEACTSAGFITIRPQCGLPGYLTILVEGYNWGRNNRVEICWDGICGAEAVSDGDGYFAFNLNRSHAEEGVHTITAQRLSVNDSALFTIPCPAPNLTITEFEFLNTGVISTYIPLNFRVVVENAGNRPVNNLSWTDIYTGTPPPAGYESGFGWVAISSLRAGASLPMTITVPRGLPYTGTYEIWSLTDSLDDVWESNEGDNTAGPVPVDVTAVGQPPPPIGTGMLAGQTWVSIAGVPVLHGRTSVQAIYQDPLVNWVYNTYSDDQGTYWLMGLPDGLYTIHAETWINGIRYSRTIYDVPVTGPSTTVRIMVMYQN